MPLYSSEPGEQPIKALRRSRNLAQADVAELLDVGPETYSRMENGIWIPTPEQLDMLVKILRAKADKLFSPNIVAEIEDRRKKAKVGG